MGPVRHRQDLIRAMAILVAFDLAAGVVALYTHSGSASAAGREAAAAPGAARVSQGGILSAGSFSTRRGTGGQPAAGATPQTTATSLAPPTTASTGRPASQTGTPAGNPNGANGANGANGTNGAAGAKGTKGQDGAAGSNGANGSSGSSTKSTNSQTTQSSTDRTGDTVVDGSGATRAEKAADVVQSQVVWTPKAIVFAVKTDQSIDPAQDPHWASENTYISWEIDTNGDTVPDFEMQYSLADGAPIGGVSHPGDDDMASVCDAEAGFLTDGYAAAIAPSCIGNPASFSYRATIYYDTEPANESADVVTDVTPDGGLSRPVPRPAG